MYGEAEQNFSNVIFQDQKNLTTNTTYVSFALSFSTRHSKTNPSFHSNIFCSYVLHKL